MVSRVDDLYIYQMAEDLSDRVWDICIKWDHFAKKKKIKHRQGYRKTSIK
jgi:hypothetical protein